MFIISAPLNQFLMKRAINIQKGLLAAKDKRMGVLNEIITSVKFIKFFAWEQKWIERALQARMGELKWVVKGACQSTCLPTSF